MDPPAVKKMMRRRRSNQGISLWGTDRVSGLGDHIDDLSTPTKESSMPRGFCLPSIHIALLILLMTSGNSALAAEAVSEVRLYVANCGEIDFSDMSFFSDAGDYDGRSGSLVVPCFIIRHPKGTLVWDTGLGDNLVGKPADAQNNGIRTLVSVTLVEELKSIGLTPADVTYVAFSHFHFDHTGNANLFASSTWILNKAELAAALSVPPSFGINVSTFSAYKDAKTQMIDGDHDVFGDGSVRILRTPGHTPGHQVLELKLKKAGVVILSGDLYHLRESVKTHRLPSFNVNRADTLASMDRVDKILANTRGRLVVQHDAGDFKSLPKFPAYLE
jgi:N-acyl homoserine lactone hydrolase